MERPLFVDREDPEFDLMFQGLFSVYSDYRCPQTMECWQYMGTFMIDGAWKHQFRHRSYVGFIRQLSNREPSLTYLNKIPQLISAGA